MEKNSSNPLLASKLFWTRGKTDLIEFIYALDSNGAINSGTADIKEVTAVFEQILNIGLDNYCHTFIEIRERKLSHKTNVCWDIRYFLRIVLLIGPFMGRT